MRIELIRLSVDVQISAREVRKQEWRAEVHGRTEQFIDIMVFGPAYRDAFQPRLCDEFRWINTAAVRGVVDEGDGLRHGLMSK